MSAIEWTDETWNPVAGCTRVSAGCDNCYAVAMTRRLAKMGQEAKYGGLVNPGKSHFNGTVRTHEDALDLPLRWRKPRRVFVNSMSDLFHRDVPTEFIDRVFAVMAMTPQHTYQVLTKRADRMAAYMTTPGLAGMVAAETCGEIGFIRPDDLAARWPLPNVWLGTSVEDQAAADERIPHLLRTPAAVRFLSCEPLLGPVDLWKTCSRLCPQCKGAREVVDSESGGFMIECPCERLSGLHGVIVGGESGLKARVCDIGWIRDIVQQCQTAGVRVFVKQLGAHPVEAIPGMDEARAVNAPFMGGGWLHRQLKHPKGGDPSEWPEDLRIRELPA